MPSWCSPRPCGPISPRTTSSGRCAIITAANAATAPPLAASSANNLEIRIVSALVLAPLALAAVWLGSPYLPVLAAAAAARHGLGMVAAGGGRPGLSGRVDGGDAVCRGGFFRLRPCPAGHRRGADRRPGGMGAGADARREGTVLAGGGHVLYRAGGRFLPVDRESRGREGERVLAAGAGLGERHRRLCLGPRPRRAEAGAAAFAQQDLGGIFRRLGRRPGWWGWRRLRSPTRRWRCCCR